MFSFYINWGGGLNRGRGLIKFSPFLRGLNRGRGLNGGNTVISVHVFLYCRCHLKTLLHTLSQTVRSEMPGSNGKGRSHFSQQVNLFSQNLRQRKNSRMFAGESFSVFPNMPRHKRQTSH